MLAIPISEMSESIMIEHYAEMRWAGRDAYSVIRIVNRLVIANIRLMEGLIV